MHKDSDDQNPRFKHLTPGNWRKRDPTIDYFVRIEIASESEFTPVSPDPVLEAIKAAARDGTAEAVAATRDAGRQPSTASSIRVRRGAY